MNDKAKDTNTAAFGGTYIEQRTVLYSLIKIISHDGSLPSTTTLYVMFRKELYNIFTSIFFFNFP